MLPMLRLFWPLCQLQGGPQDLPANQSLLLRVILLCLLTGLLSFGFTLPLADALLRATLSIAISLAIWTLLLRLLAPPTRWLQTLTAIYGCACILNLCLLPVSLLLDGMSERPGLLPLLLLGLLVWSQFINGHILRHTLEWPLAAGVALAFGIFMLRYGLFSFIFS